MITPDERSWNFSRIRKLEYARQQRLAPTPSEKRLWMVLRNRKLCDCKFRRQVAMGPYVVDFCCHEHRLIVEVDGSVHTKQVEYDRERDVYFSNRNYKVLHVTVDDVMNHLNNVLLQIETSLLPLSTQRGEGAGG